MVRETFNESVRLSIATLQVQRKNVLSNNFHPYFAFIASITAHNNINMH